MDRSPNLWLSRFPLLKTALHRTGVLSAGHLAAWDRNIVRSDIRALPYADETVDVVYSSHTLEHLYLSEASSVLAEAFRVLRPAGLLRLALPDSLDLARRYLESDGAGDSGAGRRFNAALLAHPDEPVRGVRGLVARTGGHVHRWQPSAGMVTEMLQRTGFQTVSQCAFRRGACPDLARIETREQSFFLEAVKPCL